MEEDIDILEMVKEGLTDLKGGEWGIGRSISLCVYACFNCASM